MAGHPRAGEHFPDGEARLVREARRNRHDDWQRLCAHWRDAADPDGPEQRRGRDHDLRRFRIAVGLDGVGHTDGYLTPLAAATITSALDRIDAQLFTTDWAEAKNTHGDDVTPAHLARTAAQRRHDALVEMAERALAAPEDGQRPAPLVTVMVDYPTLTGRVCELASGTVVAPGDIAQLLARDDTLIQRVVFDGPNRVRDISTARTFRGTLRHVLDAVHRRCDHPTCHVPAHRCQGDHIIPWSHGGATTQTNGRLACGPHNRWWYTHQRHRPPDHAPSPPDGVRTPLVPLPAEPRSRLRRRTRTCLVRVPMPDLPDLVFTSDGTGEPGGSGGATITVDLSPPPVDLADPWHHLSTDSTDITA